MSSRELTQTAVSPCYVAVSVVFQQRSQIPIVACHARKCCIPDFKEPFLLGTARVLLAKRPRHREEGIAQGVPNESGPDAWGDLCEEAQRIIAKKHKPHFAVLRLGRFVYGCIHPQANGSCLRTLAGHTCFKFPFPFILLLPLLL